MFGDMMRRVPAVHVYGTPVPKNTLNAEVLPSPFTEPPSSPESLLPAIDGPPSPERIRAYTEAMKRSSIFGNNSRTGTFSSASSEHVSLSRKSSTRSNSSNMPLTRIERPERPERPESVQIFGSLFSRSNRKSRRETSSGSISGPSRTLTDSIIEEESARDHYFGKKKHTRTRKNISGPKNFQHITHTRQDHLPNLQRTSRMELVSEFSAIRASQAPTYGELKGIRAQDLHFENFSSEALSTPNGEPIFPTPRSPRQRTTLKKPLAPLPLRPMGITKSHDNLRTAPPRPPRSPLSPTCPVALPARTSSRTASVLFDQFDPLATTTIERPYTSAAFRKPAPFNLPSTPAAPTREEQQDGYVDQTISQAVTTPNNMAWPLAASPSGTFGLELTDVQEEDEDVASRRVRLSVELRASQSVPALRRKSLEQANASSETLGPAQIPSDNTTGTKTEPPSDIFQLSGDSWESDIDWCYENEVEADCDYQWDQCCDENASVITATDPKPVIQPALQLSVQNDERVYNGRFRPSLLVPSPYDLPELSPMSNTSTPSSDPRTPAFLRPKHIRSPSHASSFKESHGFHLSPTLLIPADFQMQMEQDAIYQEQFTHDSPSASMFVQERFSHSFSPIDENESSTASYRSSNFSRGSARSSSSTRISSATSRGSQDSIILLSRAAGVSQAHRSIGSASSLPDLIYSMQQQQGSVTDLSSDVAALNVSDDHLDSAPAPGIAGPAPTLASLQHRRKKSLALEQGLRTIATVTPSIQVDDTQVDVSAPTSSLSPVPESFPEMPVEIVHQRQIHGRKVSAPVSPSVREFKGRARSATTSTGKARASYALFPQV
jgi:hypothetical protein